MKNLRIAGLLILALSASLTGCGKPAPNVPAHLGQIHR